MLAIIPSRQGSKGIPGKSLVDFCGKPLIFHTFEAIKCCKSDVVPVLVSDDPAVKAAAKSYGINTDYQRPTITSTDNTSMYDTLYHFFSWAAHCYPDQVDFILLQPTSPLRTSDDIDAAIWKYKQSRLSTLVGVSAAFQSVYEMVKISSNSELDWAWMLDREIEMARRQDYPENYWFVNGSIYIASIKFYLDKKTFLSKGQTSFLKMSVINSVDIDSEIDLLFGSAIWNSQK